MSVFTDGFEEYWRLPQFISIFKDWSDDLEKQVKDFTTQKSQINPDSFGHERSLIVIKI